MVIAVMVPPAAFTAETLMLPSFGAASQKVPAGQVIDCVTPTCLA